jgi:hypothetical protein
VCSPEFKPVPPKNKKFLKANRKEENVSYIKMQFILRWISSELGTQTWRVT